MTTEGSIAIAIGLVGVAIAWLAFRRERLRTEAARPQISVALREPLVIHKGYEPMRGNQLHLLADFRAAGGDVVMAETWLVAGKPKRPTMRHKGRDVVGHSGRVVVHDGESVSRRWPLVYARELPASETWWVCWQDTRGRIRDPVRVPDHHRMLMTTAKTLIEQAVSA